MRNATMCSSPAGAASITRCRPRAPNDALRLALQGQHAERDLRGDVLVGDRDVAALPQLADEPQRGRDDLVVDLRRGEPGLHRLADHGLGRDLVTGQQRRGVGAAELADARLAVSWALFGWSLIRLGATIASPPGGASVLQSRLRALDRHRRVRVLDREDEARARARRRARDGVGHDGDLVVADDALEPVLGTDVPLDVGPAVGPDDRGDRERAVRLDDGERDEAQLQQIGADRL